MRGVRMASLGPLVLVAALVMLLSVMHAG
jgi:hypothetical protein